MTGQILMLVPVAAESGSPMPGDGALIAIVSIVFGSILAMIIACNGIEAWRKVSEVRAREESRREVAAYVAEGTITPEDAERILRAGGPKSIRETIGEVLERQNIKC